MSTLAPPPAGILPSQEAVMAKAAQENFTVASAVLGRRRRLQLMAIYGFARLVDDVGDEAAGDRGVLLDRIEADLDRIYAGTSPQHAVMRTLAEAVWACPLPDTPFRRLIAANRHDQAVTHYETFAQLLDYCQLSAAPVGELVLHVFGVATNERVRLSDRICAGLQVTEHLQDVAEDHARGRVYLPQADLARFGCTEDDIAASRPSASFRSLIAFEAQRARTLLREGAPLARTLPLRPRLAVAGFVAGGRRALDAVGGLGAGHPERSRWAFAVGFATAAVGR
ncbi:MAG TPA: squalene synthase HpnC [Solirubrobacteraceae bacterium]|jgi:squalene synthase HpnC|nr:squalene synthase HpnC [Solirubrobacteraceae bacterium]